MDQKVMDSRECEKCLEEKYVKYFFDGFTICKNCMPLDELNDNIVSDLTKLMRELSVKERVLIIKKCFEEYKQKRDADGQADKKNRKRKQERGQISKASRKDGQKKRQSLRHGRENDESKEKEIDGKQMPVLQPDN